MTSITTAYRNPIQRAHDALRKALDAGQFDGLWKVLPLDADRDPDQWRYVEHDGLTFALHAECGKVTACVTSMGDSQQIQTFVSSVLKSGEQLPTASAADTKDPSRIAQELARRIVHNPQARDVAARVKALHESRHEQRAKLLAMVEELARYGYRVQHGVGPAEYTEVQAYGSGNKLHSIRINAGGSCYTERLSIHHSLIGELENLLVRSERLSGRA
jgi:hypothetical protein